MQYSIKKEREWFVIAIDGPLNFECIDDLKALFEKTLLDGAKYVRLNLKKVPVSNSSGIGCLLMFYKNLKKRGGTLVIRGISKNLSEMFSLLKIDKVLQIEEE